MTAARPRFLFVTGKLAEPALRRVLADLAPRAGFDSDVAVLNITVAALDDDQLGRPPPAVARSPPTGSSCPASAAARWRRCRRPPGVPAVLGPKDLRDLPEFFGKPSGPPPDYGKFDIEILAEINHCPQLSLDAILAEARQLPRRAGPT